MLMACTAPIPLEGRPGPCTSAYQLCHTTGYCLTPAEEANPSLCPKFLTVRQGGSLLVAVPGAEAKDVKPSSPSGLDPVVTSRGGEAFVEIRAPHGFLGDEHGVKITTPAGLSRFVPIVVSPIGVRPDGDDTAAGTLEHPFRTLSQAASVFGPGDTIELSYATVLTDATIGVGAPEEPAPVLLPPGVLLRSLECRRGGSGLIVKPKLVLAGDADFDCLRLDQRLTLTTPGATVRLDHIIARTGITIGEPAKRTTLVVTGSDTEIRSDDGDDSPLSVRASDASVMISSGAKVMVTAGDPVLTAAVHSIADSGMLNIRDSAKIENTAGRVAVQLDGSAPVQIHDATVTGRVNLLGGLTEAVVTHTTFRVAQNLGGIRFLGTTLLVHDSNFKIDGIEQDGNPAGRVVVRRTVFSEYVRQGYLLKAGRVDLGTVDEAGDNKFVGEADRSTGKKPPAIRIEVPSNESSVASASGSTFDTPPPPGRCQFWGPDAVVDGLYAIENFVGIDFY